MYYGERLNSITHLVGAVLALVGLGALLAVSLLHGDPWMIAGFSIFGLTLVMLYTMSTLYHSFSNPTLKQLFRKLDHVSIYLLIAGTYTPYMLVSLREGSGLWMLAAVWVLALVGTLLDLFIRNRIKLLQIAIYLGMGWLCTVDFSGLRAAIEPAGLLWLTLGGIAYTSGVVFYVLDGMGKLPHAHGIWHLFVLVGSLCHFISIIVFVH